MRQAYLRGNIRLYADCLTGSHGWGLLLYGALPSSLAALGVVDASKIAKNFDASGPSLTRLALVSLVPSVIFFLLVRQRLNSWYLLRWGSAFRACLFTLAIVAGAALFAARDSGASVPTTAPPSNSLPELLRGALVSIALMVGTSSLFLTVIQKTTGLPGMPAEDYAARLASFRTAAKQIASHELWTTAPTRLDDLLKVASEAIEVTAALSRMCPRGSGRRLLYDLLAVDLAAFVSVIQKLEGEPELWAGFLDPGSGLSEEDKKLQLSTIKVHLVCQDA